MSTYYCEVSDNEDNWVVAEDGFNDFSAAANLLDTKIEQKINKKMRVTYVKKIVDQDTLESSYIEKILIEYYPELDVGITERRDKLIREKAYELWQDDGESSGKDLYFWHMAERILNETHGKILCAKFIYAN